MRQLRRQMYQEKEMEKDREKEKEKYKVEMFQAKVNQGCKLMHILMEKVKRSLRGKLRRHRSGSREADRSSRRRLRFLSTSSAGMNPTGAGAERA